MFEINKSTRVNMKKGTAIWTVHIFNLFRGACDNNVTVNEN